MDKTQLICRLREQLALAKDQRLQAKANPATLASCMALKQFQSARLAVSHADLIDHPNTREAALFFLEELYGARDLTQRDSDVERIIPTLEKVMPYHALETITDAITLDALSETLDAIMAKHLGEHFDGADYAAVWREFTTPLDRTRQVELVQALGNSLCQLVRIPFLATTLLVMRGPARMAKLGNLQNFLERGFTTFKAMKNPQAFVKAITERELKISANIFAGEANPFDIST
jgi:hypothetical protein